MRSSAAINSNYYITGLVSLQFVRSRVNCGLPGSVAVTPINRLSNQFLFHYARRGGPFFSIPTSQANENNWWRQTSLWWQCVLASSSLSSSSSAAAAATATSSNRDLNYELLQIDDIKLFVYFFALAFVCDR